MYYKIAKVKTPPPSHNLIIIIIITITKPISLIFVEHSSKLCGFWLSLSENETKSLPNRKREREKEWKEHFLTFAWLLYGVINIKGGNTKTNISRFTHS